MKQPIAIIGAGIAGLTAAQQLQQAGFHPVIFEASDRAGGRMHSIRRGEFLFDLGTIALMGGNPILNELIEAAGLKSHFALAAPLVVGIVRDGSARRIDSAHPIRDFLNTDLFSLSTKLGLVKLVRDVAKHHKLFTTGSAHGLGALDTQSAYDYGGNRLGAEARDYLCSPILRGIWATSARGHSVVQLLWTLKQFIYPLYTLDSGNGSLADALARKHDVRYGHAVENIAADGDGVTVEYQTGETKHAERFAACVIATPAPAALKLYPAMAGAQRRFIEAIRFTSIVCVHLALSNRPANQETALMFPECETDDVAVVYVNHNKAPGRVPAGKGSLSVYFTQEWSMENFDLADDKLIELALTRLAPHYDNVKALIEDAFVHRWPSFIMDATPGMYTLMDDYQKSLTDNPPARIQLAGDFMPNPGINQAISSGAAAAQRIVAAL